MVFMSVLAMSAACGGDPDGGLYEDPSACEKRCGDRPAAPVESEPVDSPRPAEPPDQDPLTRPQPVPTAARLAPPSQVTVVPEVAPVPSRVRDVVRLERDETTMFDGVLLGGGLFDGGEFRGDGLDDWIAVPQPGAPAPDAIGDLAAGTISVWVRYASIANGNVIPDSLPVLYYGRDTQTLDDGLDGLTVYIGHGRLEDPSRRQIYFTVYEDYDVLLCFDSGMISLEPDRWYHYAVTIGPDGHHGYLNGREFERHYNSVSQTVQAFFSTVKDRDRMTVGHGMFGLSQMWWSFNGAIADLRIYDRVLSPGEIENLAANGP
jgi:hypothetical protein